MVIKKTGIRILYSSIGVLSAILGNIVYFVVLARQWTPEEFGYYLYIYSVATLLTLVVDYGFPQRVLKEVPLYSYRNKINIIIGASAKSVAALLIILIAIVFSLIHEGKEVLVIIVCATVLGSFADYFGSHLKALHHHKIDSANLLASNAALAIILILLSNLLDRPLTLDEAALLLLVSKISYLATSAYKTSKIIGLPLHSIRIRLFRVASEAKKGAAYAIDVALIRSYGAVDTILLRHFAGDAATGIYQSGQRLLQGILPIAQVYNNVFLPLLSRSNGKSEYRKYAILLLLISALTGISGLLLFHYAGPLIVELVFGNKYVGVLPYLTAFGFVVVLRFVSSSIAILLTATGNQTKRTLLNAISLAILVGSMIVLGEKHGTWGIIYSILISNAFLIVAYSSLLYKKGIFHK